MLRFGPQLHFLFEIAAIYVGWIVYSRQRRKRADPLASDRRWIVIVAAAAGALVGSRVLAVLEHLDRFAQAGPREWLLLLMSDKTIVGGLLGGLIGVELAKRLLGERKRSGDLFAYPLIAAIAVGRMGCFLLGVRDGTVGDPSRLPWALDQGDGIARHPTALYEMAFLISLAFGLRAVERRRELREGALFALFLSAYLAWRLAVEFIKPVDALAGGLSAIQWSCILGLLHYARLFGSGRLMPRRAPASV